MAASEDAASRTGASAEGLTAWTGWDRRKREIPQPDTAGGVLARATSLDSAAVRNYELLAVAARGFRPPQLLQSRDVATAEAAGVGDSQPAGFGPADGQFRLTWSVLYRRIADTRPGAVEVPYAIYLLGVNPPADATSDELEVFNDFYTNVHLVEVAERRGAIRAQRYELVSEMRPPYQGAPRFLASYEVDEASASRRSHQGAPYSKGPEIWQRHKTPWRLWYRTVVPEG